MGATKSSSSETCAVCGAPEPSGSDLSRVVIEGRALSLCRQHATVVATEMPETFDDMRELFVGDHGQPAEIERRSPIARRADDDRRVFPPRLEGRRMSNGRRAEDPRD